MIRRPEKLGIITTDNYQNLIRVMQRRGLRKEEPLDDVLITASPTTQNICNYVAVRKCF